MNSKEYWRRREQECLEKYQKEEKEFDKEIKRIYENQLNEIQTQINSFYGKYATAEGITMAEAKKRVSKMDIKAFEQKAAKYVKDKDFSARANEELRLYNATMRINRLEMLKANIGLETIAGHDELEKYMQGILKGRTEEELKRQAGILGKTIKNNAQLANAIPNASFHNATFSDRIWMYQDILKNELGNLLQSGLIQGKNPRVLARELKKTFNTSTSNVERLMRTELARVQTEAQKQAFQRNGFKEYEFIVNGGCCDVCAALSGKHFLVSKMMPGENAPPMHPHCRCSTAAWEDSAEYEAWLDYLDKGGSTEEWNALPAAEKKKYIKAAAQATEKAAEPESELLKLLKSSGIEEKPVKQLEKTLETAEIVNRLGGGDMTQGSCSSLALAYAGNRAGYNVLDFRGGDSRSFFAKMMNIKKIAELPNVKGVVATDLNGFKLANKLLGMVEAGKEYYFTAGQHAAVVRKTDGGYEYLELQSATNNGWKHLTNEELRRRFGCRRSRTIYGTKLEFKDVLIDVEALKENQEFKSILGFINTAEASQKKGGGGHVK